MPIYAYCCAECGHAKDVLQKMSDPVLTVCPSCGAAAFNKQLTAAGFQLKGSGWYVTDFRGGNNAPAPAKDGGKDGDKASSDAAPAAADKPAADKPAADKPAADKPAAAKAAAPAAAPPSSS